MEILAQLPDLWVGLFLGGASAAITFGFLLMGAYESGRAAERRARHPVSREREHRPALRHAA